MYKYLTKIVSSFYSDILDNISARNILEEAYYPFD